MLDLSDMKANAREACDFMKVFANENRLLILCALLEGELSVGQLNEQVALSQSALSQHLAWLREAQLVATRKEAQTVYYHLKDERVPRLLLQLKEMFCS